MNGFSTIRTRAAGLANPSEIAGVGQRKDECIRCPVAGQILCPCTRIEIDGAGKEACRYDVTTWGDINSFAPSTAVLPRPCAERVVPALFNFQINTSVDPLLVRFVPPILAV